MLRLNTKSCVSWTGRGFRVWGALLLGLVGLTAARAESPSPSQGSVTLSFRPADRPAPPVDRTAAWAPMPLVWRAPDNTADQAFEEIPVTSVVNAVAFEPLPPVNSSELFPAPSRVTLVAHKQDPDGTIPPPPSLPSIAPATGDAPAAGGTAPAANANAQPQKLGQAPEDTSLLFLRNETVLLEPGQWEVDYGIEYIWQEFVGLTLLPNNTLALERIRERQWIVPNAIRFGLTDRIQPFVNIPWGISDFERSNPAFDHNDTVFGVGDITFGFNYLVAKKHCDTTDIIANVFFTAPTGNDPYAFRPDVASLGSGFWKSAVSLTFVTPIDPAVLYGTIGYCHSFEAEHLGLTIQPGEQIFYQFGVGFAINDSLTLSGTFLGSFEGNTQVDNVVVPNSSLEPMSFRLAVTSTVCPNHICEPFVRFGFNDDGPQADFGIVWTRRF